MCSACGFPSVPGHWTDAGSVSPGDRLRARFHRAAILAKVLRPYGLTAHDDGQTPGVQLSALSGGSVIVRDLEELWEEAERMCGRAVDPLDPLFSNNA